MSYALEHPIAYRAQASVRAAFIRRTYAHLAGAILAFAALEAVLLQVPGIERLVAGMVTGYMWLVVLAAFMAVSWIAEKWAQSDTSLGMQYLGLGLYVAAEAVIFLPLLYIADRFYPGAIQSAGIMTLAVFGGLTAAVLLTRRDFSFLGPILSIGGLIALGFIVASMIIGFSLGLVFAFVMVAFASACVLYYTSQVLHRYRTDQHVAAALSLFASVALLFWYILQIVMSNRE
jgi:FtsH-binding integral membrane protein